MDVLKWFRRRLDSGGRDADRRRRRRRRRRRSVTVFALTDN